jgi:hypothetical protein
MQMENFMSSDTSRAGRVQLRLRLADGPFHRRFVHAQYARGACRHREVLLGAATTGSAQDAATRGIFGELFDGRG